ncbi:MAG: CPBP family intramembrane metalloprotease [Candidatus Obscuribacter sp.]|nr:CPBP family intramembrane metalloprotease [Candidatus Obscuribacter sp.]
MLGFVFAFTLERQRSIVPCIIAHALWNSSTFLIILLLFGA